MVRKRAGLSRDLVIGAAITLADTTGLESLSMRKLGAELGVEAMSLYKHVANKNHLLSGMIDRVYDEVDLPQSGDDWRPAMRARAHSVRAALARHPWANGLMAASRLPGPSTLRHHDAVIGTLLSAGFSMDLVAHAFSAMDAYVYGFALQERSLPVDVGEKTAEVTARMSARYTSDDYPHLAAFSTQHLQAPGYDYGDEYAYGLELVLEGLQTALVIDSEGDPRGG